MKHDDLRAYTCPSCCGLHETFARTVIVPDPKWHVKATAMDEKSSAIITTGGKAHAKTK
jgi:hypothetical protein